MRLNPQVIMVRAALHRELVYADAMNRFWDEMDAKHEGVKRE